MRRAARHQRERRPPVDSRPCIRGMGDSRFVPHIHYAHSRASRSRQHFVEVIPYQREDRVEAQLCGSPHKQLGSIWHSTAMLLQSSSDPVTPRKILVTGGAGYIGSHTVRLLLKQGHDVTVVDNLSKGYRHNVPAGRLHEVDLADTAALTRLMKEKQ